MRGTVAKRIRNEARKAAATNPTQYKIRWFERVLGKSGSDGKPQRVKVGTIFSAGYRRVYQDMKRLYRLKLKQAKQLNEPKQPFGA